MRQSRIRGAGRGCTSDSRGSLGRVRDAAPARDAAPDPGRKIPSRRNASRRKAARSGNNWSPGLLRPGDPSVPQPLFVEQVCGPRAIRARIPALRPRACSVGGSALLATLRFSRRHGRLTTARTFYRNWAMPSSKHHALVAQVQWRTRARSREPNAPARVCGRWIPRPRDTSPDSHRQQEMLSHEHRGAPARKGTP